MLLRPEHATDEVRRGSACRSLALRVLLRPLAGGRELEGWWWLLSADCLWEGWVTADGRWGADKSRCSQIGY